MKGIIKKILLTICVIGAPTSVFALPFLPDPQSLQNYMNAVRWNDGSKATFQNLGGCNFVQGEPYRDVGLCFAGFVTISNPMGSKICSITRVGYQFGQIVYETGNCRYK